MTIPPRRQQSTRLLTLNLFILTALSASAAQAAAPTIRTLDIRGLQLGGTTTITIDGTNLLPDPKIVMSLPIVKQIVQPKGTAARVQIQVTLDKKPIPGVYNLWLATDNGISNKMVVAVDHLPQQKFAAATPALPVALHGLLSGGNEMKTTFPGKAGQQVVCEVESNRIGGKIRPVLHLYGPSGKHLEWSLPSPELRGDARITVQLPTDGKYTLTLRDLQYAAPAPNHFRLKIGSWQYADMVFPSAIQRGKATSVQLIGNVPANQPVQLTATGHSLRIPAPWQNATAASGLRPGLTVSDTPEFLEAAAKEPMQKIDALPAAISGRLTTAGEEDKFQVTVKPGTKLRFEVFANRIGSPIDSILELRNDKGGRLGLNDDFTGTSDSRVDYTVPKNVESIVVAIKDANGSGGDRYIYRIVGSELSAKPKRGDFKVTLVQDRHNVPRGGKQVSKIVVDRDGYDGPIEISFENLPPGIAVEGGTIPEQATGTLLTLTGSGDGVAQVLTTIRATAVNSQLAISRTAIDAKHPLGKLQPWLGNEVAVALSEPDKIEFTADWNKLPAAAKLVLGGKFKAPVKCTRPVGYDGPVRLTLLTSQNKPLLKNGNPDPNRTLRREAGVVEIPPDAKAQAALNAQTAAAKAVTAAEQAAKTLADNGAKQQAAADANVTVATNKKAVAAKAAAAAAATAKTATDAKTAADKSLVEATEQAKVAADKGDKAIADAAAKVKAAAAAKTAADKTADKTATNAAAKAQAAATALGAAEKVLTTVQAAAKSVADIVAKADAAAAAKIKAAQTKLEAAKKAAATAAAAAKNDTEFSVLVPANLPTLGYEFAFKAELLSRDKRTVLATQYTSLRQLTTLNPIVVKLAGPAKIEARLDAKTGATAAIAGTIERLGGMKGDVTVSLAGLPGGIAVPKATVKADKQDFKLEVKFAANFKPAELKNIKIFATGKVNPKVNILVRSEDVAVTVNVLPVEKPPEKKAEEKKPADSKDAKE